MSHKENEFGQNTDKLAVDVEDDRQMALTPTECPSNQSTRLISTPQSSQQHQSEELTGVVNDSFFECEGIIERFNTDQQDNYSVSANVQDPEHSNDKCLASTSVRSEDDPLSGWSPSWHGGVFRFRSSGPPNKDGHGLLLQRRRLWFERNWQALIEERRVLTSNGLNPNAEPGEFPDVELGQNTTSPAITSRRCDSISGFLQQETSLDEKGQEEEEVLSSCPGQEHPRVTSPSSYSIGVFYSDTDQCKDDHAGQRNVRDHYVTWKSSCEELRAMARTSQQDHDHRSRVLPGSCRSRRTDRRIPNPPVLQQTPDTLGNSSESVNNLQSSSDTSGNNALPDILNSHLPPPYSTLPPAGGRRLPPPSHPPPPPPPLCGTGGPVGTTIIPGPCPHSTPRRSSRGRGAFRGFPPRDRLRSSGRRGPSFTAPAASESDEPKHCCGVMVTQTVSIRWFIVMIAFVGLCCAIVGTVLGALKATGREHLTVSLLMIGVGIVLITVSGIAWRLTSHDAPSCRAMLGLQTTEQEPNRRFVPRVPPYGRPHHPYAAMMYPEFQYRPPPPSYQASMQEYRLRLLLLDRQGGSNNNNSNSTSAVATTPAPGVNSSAISPVSPPPTYRSQTSSSLHSRPPLTLTERDFSRPPSYRSRASSAGVLRPSTETLASSQPSGGYTDPATTPVVTSHSRNPSLSLSFLSHESLFVDSSHSRMAPDSSSAVVASDNPVHFTSPSGESQNSVLAGLSDDSPTVPNGSAGTGSWRLRSDRGRSMWAVRKLNDVNAVTIVQTTDSSQVLNQDTVILSIPGHSPRTDTVASSAAGEVQILAHV